MFKKSILLTTSVAMALSVAATSNAQDAVDEIIVTATKRPQTLQQVPVAVTVTTADTIEKAQILDVQDLQSVVPSLRVGQLQTSQNTNFVIRGFGNGANNAGIEPSVGVFVDGVYRSRSAAQIGDLPKLERIEVLKGPQSTLFGKNASAGVISVVSAKPSFESEGYVEAGIGNYGQRILKGYVSSGISDSVAVSLGGGLNKRKGYIESSLPGLKALNDRDRLNIRGQILLEPQDNMSFRLIADYSTIDEICCGVTNLQNQGAAGAIAALGGTFAPDTDPFSYVSYTNKEPVNEVDDRGFSFHADIDLDKFTVTSISALRGNDSSYDQDADFNTLALLDSVNQDQSIETLTQELRLTSNDTSSNLDWMLGAFYFSEDIEQVGGLEYGNQLQPYINTLLQSATGIPNLLGTIEPLYGYGPGTFLGAGQKTREAFTQDNTAWSLFGTLDYHVSDRLTITGGLNYTKDKKTITSDVTNGDIFSNIDLNATPTVLGPPLPPVLFGLFVPAPLDTICGTVPTPAVLACLDTVGGPGTAAAISGGAAAVIGGIQTTQFQPQFVDFPNSVESGKSSDGELTYIARIAYDVSDSLNVYASYGTGFKATSWNLSRDSRPFATDAAALGTAGLLQNNQNFGTRFAGPEKAKVIEFGLKTRFSNGYLNIAVFDQQIKGFQSNIFQGTGFVLANAGKQSTQGIELDGTYSIGDLTLSGAATLLDPKYDDFANAPGPGGTVVDLSGEKVSGVAEVSLSLGALYNHEFDNGMSAFVRGDWQYESDAQIVDNVVSATTSAGQTFDVERGVSSFNASAGLKLNNGVALNLWGRNIFNDEYFISAFPGVAQDGVLNGYPNQPRTYGATLRYSFGQ